MSKVRKFVDFLKSAAEIVVAAPVAAATSGGVLKVVGHSISNPAISKGIMRAGDFLIKGGISLAKIYGKGAAIGAKALGKGAVASAPAIKAVAKAIPGSKYVPGLISAAKVAIPAYLTIAGGIKLAKEASKVRQLTGSPIGKLGSERPKFSFQSVLNTFKDALLFR